MRALQFWSVLVVRWSAGRRSVQDLDALLVWFGALGAASLVMDCANDGRLEEGEGNKQR